MKNLKNLGKVLSSKEQKSINGGGLVGGCHPQGLIAGATSTLPNGTVCAGGHKCCYGMCVSDAQYEMECVDDHDPKLKV